LDAAGSGRCGSAGTIDTTPCHHDTSRIAWAKLLARVGEEFPLSCPNCGGDIRLISFITDLGPIRKILTHLGEPLDPPRVSPARGRLSTGLSSCSPRVLGSSSKHHRMICP
jgi:NAD-dependent SIR2 family protein deacetylase